MPNEHLRNRVDRGLNTDEVAEPNCFAIQAAIAAYENGGEWLDELRKYIDKNRETVAEFVKSELPQIKLVKSEATYLLWLDCSEVCENSKKLAAFIRKETGLYLSNGVQYGTGGEKFLRLNIACPRARLADGLERLKEGIQKKGM